MEYYIVKFVYKEKSIYTVWYTCENKDVFLKKEDFIVSYNSLTELYEYSKQISLELESDITVYDIDSIIQWIESSDIVDCEQLLNIWNISIDIANTVGETFLGNDSENDEIYEKLFFGNNLPSVNSSDKKYIPVFSDDELSKLKIILRNGIELIVKQIEKIKK